MIDVYLEELSDDELRNKLNQFINSFEMSRMYGNHATAETFRMYIDMCVDERDRRLNEKFHESLINEEPLHCMKKTDNSQDNRTRSSTKGRSSEKINFVKKDLGEE